MKSKVDDEEKLVEKLEVELNTKGNELKEKIDAVKILKKQIFNDRDELDLNQAYLKNQLKVKLEEASFSLLQVEGELSKKEIELEEIQSDAAVKRF